MSEQSRSMKKPDNVTWKRLEDNQAIILDLDTGQYFSLDVVAYEVWQLFINGDSIDSIVREIAMRYDADPSTVAADIQEMLEFLVSKRLLQETDESSQEESLDSQPLSALPASSYAKPSVTEHPPITQVTGTHGGAHGGGTTHYWYPT